jgi:ABC-2 type transport system permease protein
VALYFRLLGAGMRARLQYKLDFMLTTVLFAFITAIDFLTVAAILYRYRYVAGWNIYEVALLSGVSSAANGLYRVFGSELSTFERYLVQGEFDSLMTKPWPTLASLLSRNFDLGRVGAVLQGVVLIALGLKGVGAPAWLWVYAYVITLAGGFVMSSLSLAVAAAGFWILRIDDLQTFAINAPLAAATYPQEIFPKLLRWLFLSVLPVAAFSYVPLRYALGKGGTPWALGAPFVAGLLSVAVALRFWQWGERHYQSTGN